MPLLERTADLGTLDRLHQQAVGGSGRLVLLSGEAGIGKTALVEQFSRSIGETSQVLSGACDPLSTPRPLGPLVDVSMHLDDHFRHLVADESASRFTLFTELIERLTAQPCVLIFEDIHWADEATLDLIRFLGRRIGSTRTLMIATFRDDEAGSQSSLRQLQGDLATVSAVQRMALRPLSQDSVSALAQGTGIDSHELYRLTNGNPFFVTEVVMSGAAGLPETVRDAVLARAFRLSPEARRVLDAAAAIGSPADVSLVMDVSGVAPEAVDEVVRNGLLRANHSDLVFRHELARMAVLEEISPTQSMALHGRILALLRLSSPADAARLAHHAVEAGDNKAVVDYASAAARRASSVSAHREAAAFFALAVRHANELSVIERADLLLDVARARVHIDEVDEAVKPCQEALALLRSTDDVRRTGAALYQLSLIQFYRGNGAEGEAAAQEALALLESIAPGRELAVLYSLFAGKHMVAWDMETAVIWGRKAIDLAEQLSDTETKLRAMRVVASANYILEGPNQGQAQLQECLKLALANGFDDLATTVYTDLGSGQCEFYRFAEADEAIAEGIAFCSARDLDHRLNYLLAWQSVSHDYQGRWSKALKTAERVLSVPHVSSTTRVVALTTVGRVYARRGDPGAEGVLDEALELALPTGELQRLGPVRTARALHAWLAGDLDRVKAEAASVYEMARKTNHQWYVGQIAFWLWRAGDTPEIPGNAFRPYRAQMAGRWREAAAEWRKLGCPFEAAIALADSPDESDLRFAHVELIKLGATPAAAIVAQKLREKGAHRVPRGPRPSTQSNPFLLTNREMEILALIANQQSTNEISESLFLSPRTIGHHISSILTKLGVRNRDEAIGKAVAAGIVKPSPDAASSIRFGRSGRG